MGDRKRGEEDIRSLTRNSTGTYQVSLPISLVRRLKWQERQKLTIRRSGKKLVIEDWEK